MISIIDYDAGNLRSVQKALESCGARTRITNKPDELQEADKVVFPGVGAFGRAMQAVRDYGFIDAILRFIDSGRPFLGICIGMQLMLETSAESPGVRGLGLVKGDVKRFSQEIKVPHLGWNEVHQVGASPLWENIPDGSYFYFAHSYYVEPRDRQIIVGATDYFGAVPVAIRFDNVYGLQFHPEKSQQHGLQILRNFVNL
ncbi:imidazole glycerol phosphate synthase subunit HisH [candidate division KSB1 bacterium]|nr:imidazole glycerol phosphate synthase subunit HisH [candidate division KSB1 bacterium]RQW03801.1 MAG: imidazole glycerol phosphate synthase subunit HisH [candidate division KSB1 bacterium]